MRKMTIALIVGMAVLSVVGFYWGAASAQMNSGAAPTGVANSGPFSLVRHGGFGHGRLGFGFGFGGGPYWGSGWPYGGYGYSDYYYYPGYGHYYDYPNYGTRTGPYQTCVWSGYKWNCYNFNDTYY